MARGPRKDSEQATQRANLFVDPTLSLRVSSLTLSFRTLMKVGQPPVLAIFGCKHDHYDPAVTCSGYGDDIAGDQVPVLTNNVNVTYRSERAFYTCYSDSSTKGEPYLVTLIANSN